MITRHSFSSNLLLLLFIYTFTSLIYLLPSLVTMATHSLQVRDLDPNSHNFICENLERDRQRHSVGVQKGEGREKCPKKMSYDEQKPNFRSEAHSHLLFSPLLSFLFSFHFIILRIEVEREREREEYLQIMITMTGNHHHYLDHSHWK